jgi:hypothetical protein
LCHFSLWSVEAFPAFATNGTIQSFLLYASVGLSFSIDQYLSVRFEVFTAVTMRNVVFWDITPCGSCKNRRFGGT